jgi:hypothetical protein
MDYRRNGHVLWLVVCLGFLIPSGGASAQESPKRRGELGIKFGHLGSGTIEYQLKGPHFPVETIETASSYSGGVFLSQSVWSRLHGAVTFDLHYLRGDYGGGETALDVAGGVKYVLADASRRVSLRPAALVGFAILPDIWTFKSSQYVTLKLVLELAFHTEKGSGLLIEIQADDAVEGRAHPLIFGTNLPSLPP